MEPNLDRFSRRMAWEWKQEEQDSDDDRLPFDEIICPYCENPEEYCDCP